MQLKVPTETDERAGSSPADRSAATESFLPFRTAVLLSSSDGIVLGATDWLADGELFVVADEQLARGTEVEVSLVIPASERTVHTSGRVRFVQGTTRSVGGTRSGMLVSVDSSDELR